jgi:hypothetical protein
MFESSCKDEMQELESFLFNEESSFATRGSKSISLNDDSNEEREEVELPNFEPDVYMIFELSLLEAVFSPFR